MTGGFVTGGWEFVWSAYGLTFGALVAYSASVFFRLKAEQRRAHSAAAEAARTTSEAA